MEKTGKIRSVWNGVKIGLTCFLAGLIIANPFGKKAEAGVGAREMGMGGAAVSVSDDASATYWNPAGLADAKEQATTTLASDYNYAGFASYVKPLPNFSIAASAIGRSEKKINGEQDKQFWYQLSLGKNITDRFAGGITVRYKERYLDGKKQDLAFKPWNKDEFSNADMDIGLIYKINKNLKTGLLLQDCLRATEKTELPNIRPGISFSNGNTTVALDYYDILGKFEEANNQYRNKPDKGFCFGIEQKINEALTLRAGSYKDNFTAGIGLRKGEWQIDAAVIPSWESFMVGLTRSF